MSTLTQVEYTIQEFRDNARMKRMQADKLLAEAGTIENCADRLESAIATDKKRAAEKKDA